MKYQMHILWLERSSSTTVASLNRDFSVFSFELPCWWFRQVDSLLRKLQLPRLPPNLCHPPWSPQPLWPRRRPQCQPACLQLCQKQRKLHNLHPPNQHQQHPRQPHHHLQQKHHLHLRQPHHLQQQHLHLQQQHLHLQRHQQRLLQKLQRQHPQYLLHQAPHPKKKKNPKQRIALQRQGIRNMFSTRHWEILGPAWIYCMTKTMQCKGIWRRFGGTRNQYDSFKMRR